LVPGGGFDPQGAGGAGGVDAPNTNMRCAEVTGFITSEPPPFWLGLNTHTANY